MKRLFICIILIGVQLCYGQIPEDLAKGLIDRDSSSTARSGLLDEKRLSLYADSINTYSSGAIPNFVFDQCFDKQEGFLRTFHSRISVRWSILEKVTNKQALKAILNTRDERLKKKCRKEEFDNKDIYFEIPMIKKSFYQLIKKRYKQIVQK